MGNNGNGLLRTQALDHDETLTDLGRREAGPAAARLEGGKMGSSPDARVRNRCCHLGEMPVLFTNTCVGVSECKDTRVVQVLPEM